MWTYRQSSGELAHDGEIVGYGWSGWDDGINIPAMQNIPKVGPIPRGKWRIVGPPEDSPTHGPYTLRLIAEPETPTFGRSGFLMHGRSAVKPFETSRGCLVLERPLRERMWKSGDRTLEVVG